MITQHNVVHSAVFLASTLLSVACIFLTLHAEFLAGVQVIVYVGGILVLFVFVIMHSLAGPRAENASTTANGCSPSLRPPFWRSNSCLSL